jgi:hypothetical protein
MGERVMKGIEGVSASDGEAQRLAGCRLPDLDGRAVVLRAPEEHDFDAAADAAGELVAG